LAAKDAKNAKGSNPALDSRLSSARASPMTLRRVVWNRE
jgi:hypothetical protein